MSNNPFPSITIVGDQVDPKKHIEPGTSTALFGAFIVAIFATLFGILMTYGILLIILLTYPLIKWYLHKKAMALIHGSGVQVGESQFPEIHQCVQTFKSRLNLHNDISVYVVEDNVANAMAVRYGKSNVILLTDDLIQGCLISGNPKALSFVIAHELSHIALNHNGLFRSYMARHMKKLGRLDEYSCDNVATELTGSKAIALHGILLLTVGYALLPYVNLKSLSSQAEEVAMNKYSVKAERTLTHPLLLNRIRRILNNPTVELKTIR